MRESCFLVSFRASSPCWLSSREKLILLHANNEETGQPAQLHSLIHAYIMSFLESETS